MNKQHYIHSRGGRIGGRADTLPDDVDAIVEALCRDTRQHLILHFHGGLVAKHVGLDIADRLLPVYSSSPSSGGYPVFFIWESGAWETIRNNLTELADEPVFKQLLRKVVQYALERLGLENPLGAGRSVQSGAVGSLADDVKREFDHFWQAPTANVPFRGVRPTATRAARSTAHGVDEDEILADLESDFEVQRALATLPELPLSTRSTLAPGGAVERRSAFSELASKEFSKEAGTRGLVELYSVAKYLARVLRGILRRYSDGRDHGLYATCVEELVRAFKLGGTGVNEWGKALQWSRMKQDTVDAFGPDPSVHAATALLWRLRAAIAAGLDLKRITLVGHSTGAIYIANWLENSRSFLSTDLKQDIVFLAPAITYERFADVLRTCSTRIGKFRMFAMKDELEREDQVWGGDEELRAARDWRRYLYPSSLLYLVSGILESRFNDGAWVDEADAPLLGMERFFSNDRVYGDGAFEAIKNVRAWLKAAPERLVWSKTEGVATGLACESIDHGAFDNDNATLESLRQIVS